MKEHRSASQILFGFLPEQTVDLQGRVWKVKEWLEPRYRSVDTESLRRELIRSAAPWAISGKDGDYTIDLNRGYKVSVLSLNRDTGVKVEKFPHTWVCKACNRLYQSREPSRCVCGKDLFGQLPFVGYHAECGALRAPFVRFCPTHKEVRIILPGTARADEIRFECPICGKRTQKGFGFPPCSCGNGAFVFNVHRSASVYTPRTLVVINPPSTDNVARIREAGGAQRALAWILSGMVANSFEQVAVTRESFKRSLLAQKIPSKLADDIVEQAVITGAIVDDRESIALEASRLVDAEGGAVNIALALTDSRIRIQDLVTVATVGSALRQKYEVAYPHSLSRIGLEDVEFVDSFPVLTGCYGYTRGDFTPGASRLVPFRNKKGDYIIYGDIIKTEALFVRLKPQLVFEWLRRLGCTLDSSADAKSARLSILRTCSVPPPGSSIKPSTPGTHLLTLVHTIAHWFIRKLAVLAGIERNALAEFLIPQHCAFFVYAATRGDFVLGGLQAVFESELERFLNELAASDLRCPLDPGCLRVGGACVACLHLGEPSCRYFNTYLNRTVLEGESGYLSLAAEL